VPRFEPALLARRRSDRETVSRGFRRAQPLRDAAAIATPATARDNSHRWLVECNFTNG
jgi:hypothetical protein